MRSSTVNRPLAAWAAVTCILLGSMARANEPAATFPQNGVYGSFGVLTPQQLVASPPIRIYPAVEQPTVNATGAIGLGYNRYVTPRWSVGVLGNFVGFNAISVDGLTSHGDFWTVMGVTDHPG